jgi:hypothetical protein
MGKHKTAGVVMAGVFLWALAAFAASAQYQLEEIGVFGPYKWAGRLICDRDGKTWAFVAADDKNRSYIISPTGKRGPLEGYLDVAITADGSKIVYVNKTGNDDYCVGVGDEMWGPFLSCDVNAEDSVSARGSSWGCRVWNDRGHCALINGEIWGPYERTYQVSFSADGSSWGFKARDGGKWFGVVNGEKVGYHDEPYEALGTDPVYESPEYAIDFSGDGSVWGFPIEKRIDRHNSDSYVIINDTEWGPWPWVGDLAISLDGSVWGCAVWTEGGAGAIINGEKWPPEGGYAITRDFTVSDYNGSWAFAASKEAVRWFRYVVVNGEEYGPYFGVDEIVFSPDGRQWGATVMKERANCALVINGVEREDLLGYWDLQFSPSGSTWTARTRRDDGFYRRIDGVDYGPYGYDNSSGEIVFSADDKTWVIGGGSGPVLVNGSEIGVFLDAELFASESATGFFALEKAENGYFRLLRWSSGGGF